MRSDLQRLCDREGMTIESTYGGAEVPEGFPAGTHPYKVTLKLGGRQITTPFFMGPMCEKEPTAADVLYSLIIDTDCGERTFEDFCSDMGFDEDSRKAERIYKQCQEMAPRVRTFLGKSFNKFAQPKH